MSKIELKQAAITLWNICYKPQYISSRIVQDHLMIDIRFYPYTLKKDRSVLLHYDIDLNDFDNSADGYNYHFIVINKLLKSETDERFLLYHLINNYTPSIPKKDPHGGKSLQEWWEEKRFLRASQHLWEVCEKPSYKKIEVSPYNLFVELEFYPPDTKSSKILSYSWKLTDMILVYNSDSDSLGLFSNLLEKIKTFKTYIPLREFKTDNSSPSKYPPKLLERGKEDLLKWYETNVKNF